MTMVQFII